MVQSQKKFEQIASSKSREDTIRRVRWRKLRTQITTMLRLDKQNAAMVKEEARKLISCYTVVEPVVSELLRSLAREAQGELKGLEYKLKSLPSLYRKMMSDLDEETNAGRQASPVSVAATMYDVLRYTMVIPTKLYSGRPRMQ